MKLLLILVSLALVTGEDNTTTTISSTTSNATSNTTEDPNSNATTTEDLNINATTTTASSLRLPRGTVYQIRPINFKDASSSNPYMALDSIAGIDFDLSKSKTEARDEELQSTSSSTNVRLANYNLRDSEPIETSDVTKFIVKTERSGRREVNSKREPKTSSSKPIPVHSHINEDGTEEPWDASYAFGYTLEDQARHEVSDPDGNIKGYYQYVDDEGFIRKVVYTAGAGTGFVVLNKEKIKGPHSRPPSPPRKTSHKLNNNLVSPPSYERDPRPSRPRPSYPTSPDLDDFDFPQSPSHPVPTPPRQGWSSKESGSRNPIYVVKIRKPQHKHGDDDDDRGEYFNKDDSSEDNGQWDGDIGNGPVYKYRGKGGGGGPGQPQAKSYTFGYETDTANRLEKADNYGNVRGSYSYIDNEGIKRTVHYIAGATTGFQVLGSSPSQSRSVRIEAPPGYVVTRRNVPTASTVAPSTILATAESEYPSFPPNVVVYHIHPDANSLNLSPWWDAFGLSRRPRKMRRIMRVHRKKPKTFRKNDEDDEEGQFPQTEKETQQQGPLLGNDDENRDTSTQSPRRSPPSDNLDNSVPLSDGLSPSVETSSLLSQPSPNNLIRSRSQSNQRPRPFRHSTKVNVDDIDMNTFFVRSRRPSHRAYTKNFSNHFGESESSVEEREAIRNDPILLGPSHESLRARRRLQIPNPILLKPSASRISVRSRGSRLDAAESNVYLVRSTTAGDEIQSPPTPNLVELFAAGNLDAGEVSSSREVSTSKSMQLSISSSTTRIPLTTFTGVETPNSDAALNSVSLSSSSIVQNHSEDNPSSTPSTATTTSTTAAPQAIPTSPNPRENTLALTEKEFDHTGIISSSTRLMQRLGVPTPNNGGNNK